MYKLRATNTADAVRPNLVGVVTVRVSSGIMTTRSLRMAPRHDQSNKQKRKKNGEMKMEDKERDVRREREVKAPDIRAR